MEFSKEYHAAKKEIEKIEKDIKQQKAELKKKAQSKKDLQNKNEALKQYISSSKERVDAEILKYMKEKIRLERCSSKSLLQIEDDPAIDKINRANENDVKRKKAEIEENNASISALESESKEIKAKIAESEKQLRSQKLRVVSEEAVYSKEMTSPMIDLVLEDYAERTLSCGYPDDDDDYVDDHISSYSPYDSDSGQGSSYSSGSSYDSKTDASYSSRNSSYGTPSRSDKSKSIFSSEPSSKQTKKTWYLISRNGKNQCVEVEHYTSNGSAAKRDMMSLYGISSSEIVTSSSGSRNPWPTMPCNRFDGTNSH